MANQSYDRNQILHHDHSGTSERKTIVLYVCRLSFHFLELFGFEIVRFGAEQE